MGDVQSETADICTWPPDPQTYVDMDARKCLILTTIYSWTVPPEFAIAARKKGTPDIDVQKKNVKNVVSLVIPHFPTVIQNQKDKC